MRRSYGPLITAALLVGVLALAGCTQWLESPAKPANDAIAVANSHLSAASKIEDEVESKVTSLEALPATKAGASQGLGVTKALRTSVATEKKELEAAKKALDGVASLEVSKEYKKYATLEARAIDTRATMTDTTLRLFDAMDVLYQSLETPKTGVEPSQIMAVISQVKQELSDLSTQAADQAEAAANYYSDNGLGR